MSIKDMVNAIASGHKAEASKMFQDEMLEKIQDAVHVERVRVAANFLQPAMEEEVEVVKEELITEEEMTDNHAKEVAKKIAASHKNFKVSSFPADEDDPHPTHFVHHKDDEDGHEHIKVHAKDGHIHVNHSYGHISDDKTKHSSVDSAVKVGIKAATGK